MAAKRPHLLFTAYPAQGHVAPLMKFARLLSNHGIKVTFLNCDFIHAKLLASMSLHESEGWSGIKLASFPDGLDSGDVQKDRQKLRETISRVLPGHLKDFIQKVNGSMEGEQITCLVADIFYGWWPIELAKEMGIEGFSFCPFGPGTLALALHIPKLIEARMVKSSDGSPLSDELVLVSEGIPALRCNRLPWCCCPGGPKVQETLFRIFLSCYQTRDLCKRLLCNCVYELDSAACDLIPNILPLGPLLPSNSNGNFWPEDSTCLSWLDNQPAGSVVYVAFGSLTNFNQHQINELALGLELVGRPFLWVVRSDFTSDPEYLDGFIQRVASQGKIVSWAPQEKVLSHPAVACFLSHCGWNSTMEGMVNGVPFLCWPYLGDQFHNQSYICGKWNVGLGLNPDENGIVSRQEIKKKIEKLVSDDGIKGNAKRLKEIVSKSRSEGGSSSNNLKSFIEAIVNP